jgi:hypothetical protein
MLVVGQTATFLSPAGQAIGNGQVGLPEETIHSAWKVAELPLKRELNTKMRTGLLRRRDHRCAYTRRC